MVSYALAGVCAGLFTQIGCYSLVAKSDNEKLTVPAAKIGTILPVISGVGALVGHVVGARNVSRAFTFSAVSTSLPLTLIAFAYLSSFLHS